VLGVTATIGIRSDSGVHFGTFRGYREGLFRFVCDARLQVEERVELRMELPGASATIYGTVKIERVHEDRQGGAPGYVARVVDMSIRDRDALRAWMEDLAGGGTSRAPDRTLSMSDHVGALRSLPPSQIRRALQSFDRRAGTDAPATWGVGEERSDGRRLDGGGFQGFRD
jgi:hypothetical protein